MRPQPRRWIAFAMVALAGLAVLIAAVVAAQGEEVTLAARPSTSAQTMDWDFPTMSISRPEAPPPTSDGTLESMSWLEALLSGLVVLGVLTLIVVVVLALHRAWRKPTLRVPAWREDVDVDPGVLAQEAADAAAGMADGTPRNAIVAAWVALESAAERAGAPRDPAETSSEYVGRVLGGWPVTATALQDLAALYREARFSEHELTEEHREAARAALQILHSDLTAVAAERAVAP